MPSRNHPNHYSHLLNDEQLALLDNFEVTDVAGTDAMTIIRLHFSYSRVVINKIWKEDGVGVRLIWANRPARELLGIKDLGQPTDKV